LSDWPVPHSFGVDTLDSASQVGGEAGDGGDGVVVGPLLAVEPAVGASLDGHIDECGTRCADVEWSAAIETWFAGGVGVSAGLLDSEPEQVAEPAGVAAGGDGLVEDPVVAQCLSVAGEVDCEFDPSAANGSFRAAVRRLMNRRWLVLIAGVGDGAVIVERLDGRDRISSAVAGADHVALLPSVAGFLAKCSLALERFRRS
jgi:hypothetical protein